MALFLNTCPLPGDTDNVLLAKIAQTLCEGGGGPGGGVTSISVDGGPAQTGNVSITTGGGFSEAQVRATPLTGLTPALGSITDTDTVLSGFGKAQGRLAALEAG